ncbi:uncharacterized protein LOC100378891 [Saccoglossus kowalevskii]|uniref:Uncharacterized protein LOC100378891 n=1 Tax=Saccoglossus kowalevskii TaxID=10224 RepID=A0ABM0MYA6_SACKO|nr:PREDICTED: uncharacterized protein LOC100378891 [Saccoglossus kowalevskii]
MNRRVLGSLGAGTRTMQPHMISNTATSMMPSDPFLTPPHHATPRESQRDLLIREYGKLKSRLNLTKAEYQLHRNNIGYHSTDVNEEDDHSDLVVGVFETPPKTPKESNEKRKCQTSGGQDTPTSSKPKAKKQRVQRTVQPVSISTQICGLTKEQLINVVTSLSDNHPELEEV